MTKKGKGGERKEHDIHGDRGKNRKERGDENKEKRNPEKGSSRGTRHIYARKLAVQRRMATMMSSRERLTIVKH